ncbi:ammonium transporter Rh type B-like [Tigriopus californicus]|nr:ammonium transporter Rh type B-like [Tigriopus californicus]
MVTIFVSIVRLNRGRMNVSFAISSREAEYSQNLSMEEFRRRNKFKQVKFAIYLIAFEMILLCVFLRLARYSFTADASMPENGVSVALGGGGGRAEVSQLLKNLTFLGLVQILFKGNASSLMQIKAHSCAGQILHLLVIALGFQLSLICRGLFYILYQGMEEIPLDVHDLSEGMMAAFALSLASMFVIGRTAGIHLIFLISVFIPLFNVCKLTNEEIFMVTDPGNALTVHLFAAIFGWTLHIVTLRNKFQPGSELCAHKLEEKDVWSTFGPITLFITFPIINAIQAESDADMGRAIINTIMAQVGSMVFSLAIMVGVTHINDRMYDYHVLQGSFVSGGVAIASSATLMVQPHGALIIGLVTGLISTVFYLTIEDLIQARWRLPCTSGLFSFHGIPAFIGGITAAILAAISEARHGTISYHNSLYPIYPARVPDVDSCKNTTCSYTFGEIISNYPFLEEKALGRTAGMQALFQLIGVLMALTLAIMGGLTVGLMNNLSSDKCGNEFPNTAWNDDSFLLNQRQRSFRRQSSSKPLRSASNSSEEPLEEPLERPQDK